MNAHTHRSAKKAFTEADLLEYRLDEIRRPNLPETNAIFTHPSKEDLALSPAFVDLDYQSESISYLSPHSKLIASYHNYESTPDLEKLFNQMQKVQADFYKIATFANSSLDALRMMRFRRKHPNVIGICMGEKGLVTRVTAPICGQHHTYASLEKNDLGIPLLEELLTVYNYRHLNPQTKIFALIGDPVSLSPSHITHNQTFLSRGQNALYVKISLKKEELSEFFSYSNFFDGLSVTHPLKEAVLPFLQKIDPEAKSIGAVNTISQGCGYNTDGRGAWDAIGNPPGKRVAILGEGGAARAAAFEAKKRGFLPTIYYRTLDLKPYDILINATPLGMRGELALPKDKILERTTLLDMVMADTPLIKIAKEKKCRVITGKEMFHAQAKHQLKFFK